MLNKVKGTKHAAILPIDTILEKKDENINEPRFTIRAQDILAEGTLNTYYEAAQLAGCSQEFLDDLLNVIERFHTWTTLNVASMKIPD